MMRVRNFDLSAAAGRLFPFTPALRAEIVLWCLSACLVLQLSLIGQRADYVRILLLVCGLGAAAALALVQLVPLSLPAATGARDHAHLRWATVGAIAGLLSAAHSASLISHDAWDAQWWWLAGMVVSVGSLLVPRLLVGSIARLGMLRIDLKTGFASLGLFATSLLVRAVHITDSPPFVLGDEGQCGLYGRLFNAGHTPLLSISWFGLPMLSYAVSGVGLRLFGDTLDGLRLINAVVGSIGVVLVYLLGKELFGRLPGLLAGVILACSFLHVEMSRDGIHYIQGPTCITLTMYLCSLWLVRGGLTPALLAGMSLSLSLQVYWSARVAAPLLGAVLLVILVVQPRLLRARVPEILWCGVGTVVAGLPVAALFQSQPGTFAGHQAAVSVLGNDPGTRAQIAGEYGTLDVPIVLWHQAGRMLPTFNVTPDATSMFGPWGGSMLDIVTAALLPAAIVLAVLRIRQWQYAVPLIWIAAVVLGGILTLDPPNWPRTTALLPAFALVLGILLAEAWTVGRQVVNRRLLMFPLFLGLLGWMAYANLDLVFDSFPRATLRSSMTPTDIGTFLQHAPDAAHTILLSDGSLYITYEAIQFLAPHASGCTLMPGKAWATCPDFTHARLFIILPGRAQDLPALQRRRPGGRVLRVGRSDASGHHVIAYELPLRTR